MKEPIPVTLVKGIRHRPYDKRIRCYWDHMLTNSDHRLMRTYTTLINVYVDY
jgi:hypothetical protein